MICFFVTVDGFLFLIIGTALYNGLFDCSFLPCIAAEPQDDQDAGTQDGAQGQDGAAGASGDVGYDNENEKTPLLKDNNRTV